MKQFDTVTKNFGGNAFFIRPFGAFDAARITGDLSSTLVPLVSGLIPAVSNAKDVDTLSEVAIDYEKLGPSLAESFSMLEGEKIENCSEHCWSTKTTFLSDWKETETHSSSHLILQMTSLRVICRICSCWPLKLLK